MQNNVIFVGGSSSAGKSTFISRVLTHTVAALPHRHNRTNETVHFCGAQNWLDFSPSEDLSFVHYNALLCAENESHPEPSVAEDPRFVHAVKHMSDQYAFLCYTPDHLLDERIRQRTDVEPMFLAGDSRPYPSDKILAHTSLVSQRRNVLAMADELNTVTDKIFVVISTVKSALILPLTIFRSGEPDALLERALKGDEIPAKALAHYAKYYDEFIYLCAQQLAAFQAQRNSEARQAS